MAKEFEIFYPYQYDEHDKKIIDEALARMNSKSKEPIPGMPGMGPNTAVLEDMIAYAKKWAPWNPLYSDPEYAKASNWEGLMAYPTYKEPMGMGGFMIRGDLGLEYRGMAEGEQIVGNGMDHEVFYYKPIRPGDVFTAETGKKEFRDITPEGGSTVRCLWSSTENLLFNQEGDLVARSINRSGSNFKRYKDPADRGPRKLPRKNMAQFRKCHTYTEEDYERIRTLWRGEKIRGKETLCWEDVSVGDEPAPTCDGPITAIDMIRLHGETILRSPDMRQAILKGETSRYEADDYGMFYMDWAQHYCDRNIPGARPVYYNTTARNQCLRMLTNWCGDDAFVCKVAWRLVYETGNPFNTFPETWDRPSYLFKVPYLREAGRFMNTHGIVGDTSISHGYVTDKYIGEDGGHYVDLTGWVEDLDGNIMQELAFTVLLPSRES